MKMEDYERQLRKQLKKEGPEIDLDATWLALQAQLEAEMPNTLSARTSGYFYTGLLIICLLLGYCISRPSLNNYTKSNISKLGTIPIGVESHFAAGPSQLVEMPSSSFAQQEQGRAYAANVEATSSRKSTSGGRALSKRKTFTSSTSLLQDAMEPSLGSVASRKEMQRQMPIRQREYLNALSTITPGHFDYQYLLGKRKELGPALVSSIKIEKKKALGLATYLGMPFGHYGAKNTEFAALAHAYSSSLSYLESYGLKLTGSLAISTNVGIRLGIEYNRVNQLLETEMTSGIQRTLKDAVLAIKINPVTNDTTFVRGDVIESGTVFQSIRHYNRTSALRIPIQLEYVKNVGTWGYGLSAGASLIISQRSEGRFIQNDGSISPITRRRDKGWQSLIIEPILEKELDDKFIVEMRPYFMAPLQRDPNIELLRHKPIQVGLGVGFQYRW